MKRCKECKTDLRAGKSWTEEEGDKTYRCITLICPNKKCGSYKQIAEIERSETHEHKF